MPRQYAPRTFLRLTDQTLVRRYFEELRPENPIEATVWDADDWASAVFEAWQQFPDEVRAAVDADFQRINELTSDAGVRAISEEVAARRDALSDQFETLDGSHERAMLLFIDAPAIFDAVERFAEAYDRSPSQWKRRKSVPRVSPRSEPNDIAHFSYALSEYLRHTEGRGGACQVDPYERGGKFFYFTYPEDYGAVHLEYDGGVLARRVVRPAFEIDFVYCPEEQTLDIHCSGSRKRIADLQQIFGRVILGVELGPSPFADRVLNLNKLKSRDHRFVYGFTTGIRDVTVKRLGFTGIGGIPVRHVIESDPKFKRDAVYDEVERTFLTPEQSCSCGKTPLSLVDVFQSRLTVAFAPDGRPGRRTRTFDLTAPNTINLGFDGRDAAIRQMLLDSEIDTAVRLARSA
ncbi:MAG: hypothetical protein M3P30_09330 [Chloroflexota bacterium]|nr:hypothetical protein [Chloroflexota bacterium]